MQGSGAQESLATPSPLPLSPKGEREDFVGINYPLPLGGEGQG
jgi:hypothetical protein